MYSISKFFDNIDKVGAREVDYDIIEWPELYPKAISTKLNVLADDVDDHLVSNITEQCISYYVLVDFFNLYCYNFLDFKLGKGAEELKYQRSVFVTASLENKIRDKYEQYCERLFDYIFKVLETNCYHEFGYIYNKTDCIDNGCDYSEIKKTIPPHLRRKISRLKFSNLHDRKKRFSYTDIEALFKREELWEDQYGGELWGNGAAFLSSASKCKNVHDKFIWIDKVLDLYHNSGHILNKSIFAVLSYNDNENCLTSFVGDYLTFIKGVNIEALEEAEDNWTDSNESLQVNQNPLDLRANFIRSASDYTATYSKYFIDTFARNVIIAQKNKL